MKIIENHYKFVVRIVFDRGYPVVFITDNDFTQYGRLTQRSIYLLLVK